ncbi:intersectin-EH binding protein Ibp1 [Mycolicibacterium moriokaense]|nr:intersectin-EH binding protein Ibp1 [Mycolicibacterium moriokaense]
MATMKFPARRLIIAGGFAVAVAAAPAIAFVATPTPMATPLAECAGGEEPDLYTSICVPHLVPNAGEPYQVLGGNPDLPAVSLPGGGGAIPCTGHNSGQCIGLAEEQQVPVVQPESTVGSSPTVTGSTG